MEKGLPCMNYPRGALCAALIGTATLLAGCGTTHIVDTSPTLGSPRIVASDVTVKVTPYADATAPSGGRVEKQEIIGQVVMSREAYANLLQAQLDNKILGAYAEECARAAK